MAPPPPTQYPTQHQHPTLPLDSPASASSSTLITPLPLDPLAEKGSSADLFAPARARAQTTTRKRPSLSLSLGSGGGGGGGPGSEQGRMSGKGFIEPHHGHLPRRARTTVRKGAASANKEGAARVASTPTPNTGRTRVLPHLQSPTATSTIAASPLQDGDAPLQTGMTTLTEPPTSSAFPPTSTSTLTPAPWSHSQSPTTPTPIPTTPTPTANANLIPTRSTIMSNTIDAVLASASASAASDPSMLTSHHHPALGLTMNLTALANSGKPLPSASHQNSARPAPLPISPIPLLSLSLEQEQGVPTPTPTPAPLGTPGPGVNLPRRHQRRGPSASPAPAQTPSRTPLPLPTRTPIPTRTPAPDRRRVHSSSRTRELTASDLARMHRAEDARKRAERREAKRWRACVQCIGSGSRVEVGFLDEEECDIAWFEEEGESQGNEKEEGGQDAEAREGKDKDDVKGKAPYVLIKVLGASCSAPKSKSKSGSGSSASSSSSSSDSEQDAEIHSDTDSGPGRPTATSLRLPLPTTRTAYVDGSSALSNEQMREACAFIGGWLQSSEEEEDEESPRRTRRVRVRILAPWWRPEDAMGIALCYLAGLGRGTGDEGGETVIASSPRVNDLRYFAAGSESCQPRESAVLPSPASLPSPSSSEPTPSPAPSAPLLPTPDVYAYSRLHLLAMRLLDDDAAWIGRGALYEARTRLSNAGGEKEEEDVFGSFPVAVANPEANASSADDTLGSSTQGDVDVDLETRGRGRGRKHAREGAEWAWRWRWRSESAPSPAVGRGPSLAIGKEERKEERGVERRRRAETRERPRDERVGRRKKEVAEEEWTGLQDAWRGVLSFDGLARLAEVVYGDGWVAREMGVL